MKSRPVMIFLLTLLVMGLPLLPAYSQGLEGLVHLDGSTLEPDALEGDAIVIFFASWSPRCRNVVAQASSLQQEWGTRAAVFLVSFQESEEEVRAFLDSADVDIEILRDVDGSFSKRHGITTLPSLLVLEGGTVAFRGRLTADASSALRPIFG
jgi:thiol-disulfide isomerase/thioredoxin